MIELTPTIPDVMEQQLPSYIRGEENAKFIAFMKHYYDWLIQEGQPTDFIHNILTYRDIDLTNDAFRLHITESLLDAIPAYSQADRTLLTKHITEFLQSKGSFESFQFIMNSIYGEDIEMVWNSDKIFRPSANDYFRVASLAIESDAPWTLVEGTEIVQTSPTPASAIIESCVTTTHDGQIINWLTLDYKTVIGKFTPEGTVEALHNNIDRSWYHEEEYYQPVSFTNNTIVFLATHEEARPYENLYVGQIGSDFFAVVNTFVSRYQETGRTRITLTLKDAAGTFVPGSDIYIYAPALSGNIFTKEDYETGVVSKSVIDVSLTNRGSLYSVGDRIKFINGSGLNVDGYVSEVTAGGIESVNIVKKGYGYSVGDKLRAIAEAEGTGAEVEVSDIDGIDGVIDVVCELNGASIIEGGYNYAVNDELEIVGGTRVPGTPPARIRVTAVSSTWLFKGVKITKAGSSYPRYTKIALIDTGTLTEIAGFAATPTFNQSMGISAITVTSTPTISTNALAVIENGYVATETANLMAGAVNTITVGLGGVNYIDPIAYVVGDGAGAVLTVVTTAGVITGITVEKGGSGYTTATVVIKERFGSGFAAVPLIQNQTGSLGTISTFTILDRGSYLTLPDCFDTTLKTVVGSGEAARLNLDFRLKSAAITDPGHYYQQVDVTVSGKGSGALLVGTLNDGVITSFNKILGGSGYTYAYVFVADGVGFIGTANIVGGAVDSITILNGGYGYSAASVVTIVGDGTGASYDLTGVGNIKNGVLAAVTVLNGGSGYYHGTTVTCTATEPGAISATMTPVIVEGVIKSVSTNGGSGYIQSNLDSIIINSGTAASITGTVSGNGAIAGYEVTDGGSGYWAQSEVTPLSITTGGAGAGALFIPTLNSLGEFTRVDVLYGGSGYDGTSTISVTGGGGTGVSLKPVVFGGRITDVTVLAPGVGYKYGTYAVIVGDGIGGAVTPVVETGITSAEVLFGGADYTAATVINVTDTAGTGAVIRPVIVGGVIVDLEIINKGTGYVDPQISASDVGGGSGSSLVVIAKRFIKDVTVTDIGSGFTYADVVIIGDGADAEIILKFEKLGSIDTITLANAGTGITLTPVVTVDDLSGYGAVSAVRIIDNGAGYNKLPILVLDDKYDELDVLIASGTRFTCFGSKVGGVRRVLFDDHGAHYNEAPTPIFQVTALLAENAAFRAGEEVTIKNGTYRDVGATSYLLLETGDRLLLENGDFLTLSQEESYADSGVTGTVVEFDYDRNIIKIESDSDIFDLIHETNEGKAIVTENGVTIIDEMSGSFDVGDVLVGSQSGAHATIINMNRANGRSVIGGNGWSAFRFRDQTGILNDKLSVIADNNRYQDYAYVIRAGRALKDYEQLLKDTVHPAGFSMFGDVVTHTYSEMGILGEIGYNELVSVLYILAVSAVYQDDSQWSNIDEIFGDFTKFNFVDMPISLVEDRLIHSTSSVIFMNADSYAAPPVAAVDPMIWYKAWAQTVNVESTAPDGSSTMVKVSDTLTDKYAYISSGFVNNIGDRVCMSFFVKKQVNPTTYPLFRIGLYNTPGKLDINFNTETGVYSASIGTNPVVVVKDLGDYWWIHMENDALISTCPVQIFPAVGTLNAAGGFNPWGVEATGSITMSDIILQNITGLAPYNEIVKAVNSTYAPEKLLLSSTETVINIS